jgi:glycerol-3-phosphate dehydrogenase
LAADTVVKTAAPEDLIEIPGTNTIWAELPYVARNEGVRHLDDLLLRRVRIGLLTQRGGKAYFKRIRKLCRNSLPWDRRRWKREIKDYLALWNQSHALPVQRARALAKRKFFFRAIASFFKFLYRHGRANKQVSKTSPAG